MFKILVLDNRYSIQLGLKYLLYRYEIVFGKKEDIVQLFDKNEIDITLVNLARENGSYSNWDLLKTWAKRKRFIAIADSFTKELAEEVRSMGALECVDKLDLHKLPYLVERYLNKAETRIILLEK